LVRLKAMFVPSNSSCRERASYGAQRSQTMSDLGWRSLVVVCGCAISFSACGTDRSNTDDAAVPPPSTTLTPLPTPSSRLDAGGDASAPAPIEDAGGVWDAEPQDPDADVTIPPFDAGDVGALRLNEAMSQNDGAWVDEFGEADDWLELFNPGSQSVRLSDYRIIDGSGALVRLPEVELRSNGRIVLFADDSPEQGLLHLPFKLSSSGDELRLLDDADQVVDSLTLPELAL